MCGRRTACLSYMLRTCELKFCFVIFRVWGIRQGATALHAEPQGSILFASTICECTTVLWPSLLPGAVQLSDIDACHMQADLRGVLNAVAGPSVTLATPMLICCLQGGCTRQDAEQLHQQLAEAEQGSFEAQARLDNAQERLTQSDLQLKACAAQLHDAAHLCKSKAAPAAGRDLSNV